MAIQGMQKAEEKHPHWPEDILHAVGILVEEVGELQKACLEWVYEDGEKIEIEKEAIHSAAMALRFMKHLYCYNSIKSKEICD